MRYPPKQKAETHAAIVSAAARLFRERGAEANGIGSVMKELGLTKGGFYRHFKSRDHLYVEAIAQAFTEMGDGMIAAAEAAPKGKALQAIINRYLSMGHLASPGIGCVVATLGSDIARQSPSVRRQIARHVQAYRERLFPYMPGSTQEEKASVFSRLYPSMVGTMIAARAAVDKANQEAMLAQASEYLIRQWVPTASQ